VLRRGEEFSQRWDLGHCSPYLYGRCLRRRGTANDYGLKSTPFCNACQIPLSGRSPGSSGESFPFCQIQRFTYKSSGPIARIE
jgi:hypothetical protein